MADEVVPDRRDAASARHPLALDEPGQRLGLQEAVRHDERRARHEAQVGESPGVGVEERHHGEEPVSLAHSQRHTDGSRVQVVRPVRVRHPLGVAGRPGGVAHRARGALVEVLGPVEVVRLSVDEVVEVVDRLDVLGCAERLAGCVVDGAVDDDVAQRRQVGEQLAERGRQGVVDDDDLVVGVRGDVDELLREQPDVERVEDRAHRRHRQVGDEVLGVVPHERGDALVAVDAQPAQCMGQLRGASADLRIRHSTSLVPGAGDDLLVRVDGRSEGEDRADEEGRGLHRAVHGREPANGGIGWSMTSGR